MSAYKRRRDLIAETIDDETLVLDRRRGRVHHLNATATRIWEECDGVSTIDDITATLLESFDEPPASDRVLKDVLRQLEELERLELVKRSPWTQYDANDGDAYEEEE